MLQTVLFAFGLALASAHPTQPMGPTAKSSSSHGMPEQYDMPGMYGGQDMQLHELASMMKKHEKECEQDYSWKWVSDGRLFA